VDVEQYRSALQISDQLLALVAEPVPRKLYPNKPADFSERFTRQLYPAAADGDVAFATPLVAEASYRLRAGGVAAAHLLLGLLAGLGRAMRRRVSAVFVALVVTAACWSAFVFVRGDAGNAAFAAAPWILCSVVAAPILRRRAGQRPTRLVVDALQVPPELSGVARQLRAIGGELALPEDIEVILRCPRDVVDLMLPSFPNATLHTPLASSRPRWRRIVYQQIVAPVRDGASTLVVCPGDQAPLWGRSRVALIVHDVRRLTHPETAARRERAFYRLMQPASIRRAHVILTVSAFTAGELARVAHPQAPVIVVAHHPRPLTRQAATGRGGGLFLTVGALRRYKGVEDVIDALGDVPVEHVRKLIVVGSGEGRLGELERRARERGVGERVVFRGWLPDDELEQLYGSVTTIVCPSHYEGYGLSLAEGQAHGLPTISSRIPSHVEVAGEAARYFPAGDTGALAAALTEIGSRAATRDELARLGLARSRELATQTPRWGEAIDQALALAFCALGGERSRVAARTTHRRA
jgi:glycosyltransferase involved in cell wall biosynthesis